MGFGVGGSVGLGVGCSVWFPEIFQRRGRKERGEKVRTADSHMNKKLVGNAVLSADAFTGEFVNMSLPGEECGEV